MDLQTRQFDFTFKGLHVHCSAYLYSDGSLARIEIDHIMNGLIDYHQMLRESHSSLVRYARMKLLKALRIAAAVHAASALSYAYDNYEFEF